MRITISAGVHSREYVGMEAVNRLAKELDPKQIHGQIRLIHAINYNGLIKRSADVFPEDGKNLNRVFPGDANGTSTCRVAAFLEEQVIATSDIAKDDGVLLYQTASLGIEEGRPMIAYGRVR